MIKLKSSLGDSPQLIQKDSIYISSEEYKRYVHSVHIDTHLDDPEYFRDLQHLFDTANEDDVVIIHLNSGGGDLFIALLIYNWILRTDAHVIVELMYAASGATFFVLAADEVRVLPNSCMMIHGASYGTPFYDQQKVKGYVEFQDKHIKDSLHDVYKDFLSEDELTSIVDNSKELWMHADEIEERLRLRNDILTERHKEALKKEEEVCDVY